MRLWLAMSVLWIVGVAAVSRPDRQLSLLQAPIEIQFARHQFRFPAGTAAITIAAEIDRWIAAENALARKLRDGAPLDAMTDDELIRMAHKVGVVLDRSEALSRPGLRTAMNWDVIRQRLPETAKESLSLVGEGIAADVVSTRSESAAQIVGRFGAWALLPPLSLFLFGAALRRLRETIPSHRSAR